MADGGKSRSEGREAGECVADASKGTIAVTGGRAHAEFTRLVLCIRLSDCVVGFKHSNLQHGIDWRYSRINSSGVC